MNGQSTFFEKIYEVVKAIPSGQVATYGQVAAVAGHARAARVVGMALAKCVGSDVPWQRVINRHGMISIENMSVSKEEQVTRLQEEAVEVKLVDNNYMVNLERYLVDNRVLEQALTDGGMRIE